MGHLIKWEWYDTKVMQLTEEKGTERNDETKEWEGQVIYC